MIDVQPHNQALVRRCQALLGRYLHRYWYRAVQGGGSLGDLFVTVEELSRELEIGEARPPIALEPIEALEARIDLLRGAPLDPELPLARLARESGAELEVLEILEVLVTLQGSPGLLRACTFAWADFSVKQPTVAFVLELLADDSDHRARLEIALAPDGVLRRLCLLQLGEDRRFQPSTPMLQRPAFVPDAVYRFLRGQPVRGEA